MTEGRAVRVLMVGINYAPEQTGIAPYTAAAAEHLAALGHDVTVFTGVPHYPAWSTDAPYRWSLSRREVRAGVTVHHLRHFVPRRQDALRRGLYEATFALQVAIRARRAKADVVIAIVPSLLSAGVAAKIARGNRAPLVVWLQDSMSAAASQSGMPGGRAVAGLVARAEQSIIKRADTVLVVSEAFRQFVERIGVRHERIISLANWVHVSKPTKDRMTTRREHHWDLDELVVVHSGNMGLKQDLGRVVEAGKLALGSQLAVRFVLMGDGSQRAELLAQAEGLPNVSVIGAVSDDDYSNVLHAADLLLVNEREGVTDMSLPSKLTSYLTSGRPVVAAVDRNGSTAAEVLRSGGGVVTASQTPQGICAEVTALGSARSHATHLGRQGQLYAAEHLSAESSLRRLADVVGEASRRTTPA